MKVFVYESVWKDGEQFEGSVAIRLFSKKNDAINVLNADTQQSIEMFINVCGVENVKFSLSDTRVEIEANNFCDCWTGMVYEKEVE